MNAESPDLHMSHRSAEACDAQTISSGIGMRAGPGVDPRLAHDLLTTCLARLGDIPLHPDKTGEGRHRVLVHRAPAERLAMLLHDSTGPDATDQAMDHWADETTALLALLRQNRGTTCLVNLDAALGAPDVLTEALAHHFNLASPPASDPPASALPASAPSASALLVGKGRTRPDTADHDAADRDRVALTALAHLLLKDGAGPLCDELDASGLIASAPRAAAAGDTLLAALRELRGRGAFHKEQAEIAASDLAMVRDGLSTTIAGAKQENAHLSHVLKVERRTAQKLRGRIEDLQQALTRKRTETTRLQARLAEMKETIARTTQRHQALTARGEAEHQACVSALRDKTRTLSKTIRQKQNLSDRLKEVSERRAIEQGIWKKQSRAQADLELLLQGRLKTLQTDLEAAQKALEDCRDQHDQMQIRLADVEAERADLQTLYSKTMMSRSWRVTAPLRHTRMLTSRLFD